MSGPGAETVKEICCASRARVWDDMVCGDQGWAEAFGRV